MKNLNQLLGEEDAFRFRGDSVITEADFLSVIPKVVPKFRELSLRPMLERGGCVTVVNDLGILKSRHVKVVDIGDVNVGPRGTGGSWDQADKATTDVNPVVAWGNVEVPMREQLAQNRGGFDIFQESVRAYAGKLGTKEAEMIVDGLDGEKGITTVSGIQTFASAGAWTTADIAYKDTVKAVIESLQTKFVPITNVALLVSPKRQADLYSMVTSTDVEQIKKINGLLSGGIWGSTFVPDDKAYYFAANPDVVELRVIQDLTVKPLPQIDEDPRARVRAAWAMHIKNADGIVEVTSIDV